MAEDTDRSAEKLSKACNEAFATYPTSCSHSVWYVIKQYIPDQPYLQANQLIDHIIGSPEWQEVQLYELSRLASDGVPVVGGSKDERKDHHGHVIVVYPGSEKANGGFYYKRKKDGKTDIARKTGVYARAMSTAMGSWPGAKSKGDKTVRDPWGKDEKFEQVKFWKYVGPRQSNQ